MDDIQIFVILDVLVNEIAGVFEDVDYLINVVFSHIYIKI